MHLEMLDSADALHIDERSWPILAEILQEEADGEYQRRQRRLVACASIRQHTSAYGSIRQHTAAPPCCLCPHTSAYVSVRQHTAAYGSAALSPVPAYVSLRQQTAATR